MSLAADRLGEPRLADDHGRALVGDAEDFGDLGDVDGPRLLHVRGTVTSPGERLSKAGYDAVR